MSEPTLGADVNDNQLEILWNAVDGINAGNSEILGYQLFWDAQSGTANIFLTEKLTLSHIQQSLSPGMPYKFKIRARNIYGTGPFSLEVVFTPVNEPATMEPVTTELNYPNIELTFIEPDNSGLEVLDYEVVFFDKN